MDRTLLKKFEFYRSTSDVLIYFQNFLNSDQFRKIQYNLAKYCKAGL